jgi:uncharacterized membrane protein YkoI
MNRTGKWIASGAIAAIIIAAGSGIVLGTGSNDTDTPLTGSALEQAAAAALMHTGGGTVIESEVGDDSAAYGVEIRLDDGSTVEVSLDQNFNVISSQIDEDSSTDQDGGSDN